MSKRELTSTLETAIAKALFGDYDGPAVLQSIKDSRRTTKRAA